MLSTTSARLEEQKNYSATMESVLRRTLDQVHDSYKGRDYVVCVDNCQIFVYIRRWFSVSSSELLNALRVIHRFWCVRSVKMWRYVHVNIRRQVYTVSVCWIAGCRACGGSSGLASTTLRRDGADAASEAAAAVASSGRRQRPSEGVYAAAVQLADGNVLGAQCTGDIYCTSRIHARYARKVSYFSRWLRQISHQSSRRRKEEY